MSIREWLAFYCIGILLLPGCATRQVNLGARPESSEETRHRQAFASEPQLRAVFGSSHQSLLAQGLLPSEEEVESFLARAQQLLISGRPTEAILLLSRLEEQGENSREILLALARAWIQSGNLPLAESYVKQSAELHGKDVETTLILGEIQFTKGEIYGAEESFQSVYRMHSDDIRVLRWMATCRFEQEDWPAGRSYLERAIVLEPSNLMLREMLAEALLHLGEENRAKDQLLALLPAAQALDKLGALYLKEEKWEDARRVLSMALTVDGTLASARLSLQEAESHLAPPAVVHLSSFRDYRQERAALLLRLEQERAMVANRQAEQVSLQAEHPEYFVPADLNRVISELYRDLDRSDSPSAETVNLQPAVTKLKAKIDIVPGYNFKSGARTGATNTSAGDTVNSNRDVAAPVSVETVDLEIGEELKEAARTSSEEVTDDSVVSNVLEGTVVTVAVHASPVADENRYRKTIAAWSSNDPAEIPSFESLTLAEIDPEEPLIADATLYSYENLLIPGRAGRDPIETVTFERNFAVSAKHSLLHFLEPTTVDLAWPARDRELPVADNPAPVAVIDLFMPARFTLSMSLPQTIVVRRRATVEPRSAPSFPSFDLKLEESLQSEPESVESCQEHEGTGKGLWGVVGAVAIMLLMILLI